MGLDIITTEVNVKYYLKIASEDIEPLKEANKKEQNHDEGEDHEHSHSGIFGKNTELIFSIICGALLGIGFGLSYVESIPDWHEDFPTSHLPMSFSSECGCFMAA